MMELKIVDQDVQGVVCGNGLEGGWYLRLQAPSILEEAPDEDRRNYIWYSMRLDGWRTVDKVTTAELEAGYVKALGGKLQ